MKLWQTIALATLVTVGMAAPQVAAAQAAGACEIDDGRPNQVKDARNALVKAQIVSDKQKQLTDAIRLLTKEPEKIDNKVGRDWVLGRSLVTLAALPEQQMVVARGTVGYATNPEAEVDLLLAADSSFDAVESAMPQCAADVEEYRRVLYVPVVNSAVNAYNDKNVDEAARLSERALIIYPKSPIAYNVLANVAQGKEDFGRAAELYEQMVAAIGDDTTYAQDKQAAMLSIGALHAAVAEEKEGAEKAASLAKAAAAYQAYIAAYPDDSKGPSGLARVQIASGDTAAAAAMFGTMISNPAGYSDMQLFEAGVNAARADRPKEAAALFEAGLVKNPYYRDALFNVSAMYDATGDTTKMKGMVERLIAVDPNNPENQQLMARYYQALANAEKNADRKKALTDSLVKYFEMSQKAPVKVTFSLFSNDEGKRALGGSVENLTDAAASYTITFEFLDAQGNVVATQQAAVGEVA
ncbi:MAG TPA: hypothetical protein VFG84_07555, partial [Gemmatimonadaceae bacterium]|nr:hypothetical protein [Gemmatimonadaceae bacterium]